MTNITNFINKMNKTNSSNDKIETLTSYKSDTLVQKLLKMTYDKVTFTYGVTMKNIPSYVSISDSSVDLNWALDSLELLNNRTHTGNAAIEYLTNILTLLTPDDSIIIEKVINRDLKIGMGRTQINKVIKNLIVKPPYTRCEIGTEANIKKNMPMDKEGNFKNTVYSTVKMDGTFRRCSKSNGLEISSRPGIQDNFEKIESQMNLIEKEDITFIGEMTLKFSPESFARGMESLIKNKADEVTKNDFTKLYESGATWMPRSIGNGVINSDNPLPDDTFYTIWDMIPAREFALTKDQIKAEEKAGTLSFLEDRFKELEIILTTTPGLDNIKLIEYKIVKNMKEAYEHFQEVTKRGEEGTVIKSHDMTHKDGNSKKQLKVKLVIELDMRFTSFNTGNVGSKNENYFSGINFTNDDGTIQGTIGVTSMTETERDWFHENRETIPGRVFELFCNDLTKGSGNDYFALSHPRYERLRDKEETDTLERALELKQLAMEVK